jgi:hypothetical protein
MAELDLGLNLYDFNKQGMSQESPLDPIILFNKTKDTILDILTVKDTHYWMLLCNERKDYTLFNLIDPDVDSFTADLVETLKNRGWVLSIDKQEDGNFEIWIRDPDTKENFVYYLFNYNYGVVEE